jgi:hypothetical protein
MTGTGRPGFGSPDRGDDGPAASREDSAGRLNPAVADFSIARRGCLDELICPSIKAEEPIV